MPRPNTGPYLVFLKKRGKYYIRWSNKGRTREKSTGTAIIGEAEKVLADFINSKQQHFGPRDPGKFLIMEALEHYAEERAPKIANPERIGYALDALTPFWENNLVSDITEQTCEAYCSHRQKSDGTHRRELGTLRAAINHEFKMGRLTRSPHVWLPSSPEGKDRWLSRAEAAALLRAAKSEPKVRLYLPLFILLGLYTGARKEALLSLRWPQVNLTQQRIDFNPIGRKQTTKKRAHIPIPRRLMRFLIEARKRGCETGYVIHNHGVRLKDIKRSFNTATKNAELIDVTPHTLRHTAGTWMAQKGVPYHEIAGYLGHTIERTTALYSHHHPDYMETARRAFD